MERTAPYGDDGWAGRFRAAGGLWRFDRDGDATRPHALLTSGLHSDGFVNCSLLILHPDLLQEVVRDWAEVILADPGPNPDWVCGSAFGAITIAYELARQLECKAAFTEPVDGELTLKRFPIQKGDRVICVEDVISTGGSTLKTIAQLEKTEAIIAPEIYALVNRSDGSVLAPRKIIAATQLDIETWQADDCPLCAGGSEAIRPKGNWAALTTPAQ